MKALIFAAGLGTRLQPLTNTTSKSLVSVNGTPMLQLIIERLQRQGINDFVINIYHFGQQILDFLKKSQNFGANIQISDERELLLDTGGGLKKAECFFKGEDYFLIHNVDIFSEINILELENQHKKNRPLVTMAVQERDAGRKLGFNENMELKAWKNFKTNETIFVDKENENIEFMAFSGIHIVSNDIFKLLPPDKAYPIIPEYLKIAKSNKILAYKHSEPVFDLGSRERIKIAEQYIKNV